jgi:hypothetical protein
VSGCFWDIGQVPSRNFDWLPFTPPLVAFSNPSKLIHLEPLGWIGGPIILLNHYRLEGQGPTHPLQVGGKSLVYSCIEPPFGSTLLVRLVIIGTIVVVVCFFMLLLFKAIILLVSVFYPVACISAVDDIAQISIILVSSSAAFLHGVRLLAESL